MNCDEARALLHGYLDGELDSSGSMAFEAHLASCQDCSKELRRYQDLGAAVRNTAEYFTAPEALRSAIVAQLQPSSTLASWRLSRSPKWRILAGAVAALLIATVGLNAILTHQSAENLVAQEVVASHARSLMANHLFDVASTDRHTVKPWLDRNLDFAPTVVDFAKQDFALAGGRLDYLDHHQVAALVYRHRQHIVNVFIWPAGNVGNSSPDWITQQGYNLAHWTASGMTYWIISDADRSGLNDLVRLLRGAAAHPPT
jgi:anti-sigma factor (TIGR02949 family)